MNAAQILKSSQEQASAAWIDYLNQLRLNELLAKLSAQDINLENALKELRELKNFIGDPDHILGSPLTKHGEIAEHFQVNISNAKKLVEGLKAEYTFDGVGRTAPEDYLRNGQPVQSKFHNSIFRDTGTFAAIKKHLEQYPDFIKNGGTYDIPKDQYEKIIELLNKPPSQLNTSEQTLVKAIRAWENAIGRKFTDVVKPSLANYAQVQQGKINDSIANEEKDIRETDQKIRDEAYEASKPSLKQGAQAAAVSAAVEGGMNFCLGVLKKLKGGKPLHQFTAEDWKELGIDTAKGTVAGGVRGAVVYAMTNFTATPAAVASALVTATFGIAGQAQQLRQGVISEEDFLINSQVLCLDVSVSTAASILGQVAIPIPVLGAVIGNTVGMFVYGISKDFLSDREEELAADFQRSMEALNQRLELRYQELIAHLKAEFAKFTSMLELAFDPDVNIAFDGSIALADYVGVSDERILRTKADVDNFFLN